MTMSTVPSDRDQARFDPPSDADWVEISPSFYLGGLPSENPFDWGADVVVSLASSHACPTVPDGKLLIHHPIVDDGVVGDAASIRRLARLVADLIAEGRVVFVHCFAGRDRSPMLAARVLIEQRMTPADAIAHVRRVRTGALGDVPAGLWGKAGRGYATWLLSEEPSDPLADV